MRPPRHLPAPDFRSARSLILRLAILIFLVIAALGSISFYVESLWYGSLGFESVYWYRLRTQSLVFLAFGGVTAIALWAIFRLVTPPPGYTRRPFLQIGQEAIVIPTTDTIAGLAKPVAIILGVFFGLAFSSSWSTFALFLNHTATPADTDPVFGRPLSFYLFTLPVLDAVTGWFLAICVIGLIAAIVLAATDMLASFRGVSLALCLLLIAAALRIYVSRYGLLFQENTLFSGVRYVDQNILIPGLLFVIAALLAGAVLAGINMRTARLRNLILAVGIPAVTYIVAGVIAPLYVTTFVVRPNELVRETPYIKNNIEFTRKAYGFFL